MEIREKWQTFADRWVSIIIHPRTFFDEWDREEPWSRVIIFNIICGLLGGIGRTILLFGKEPYVIVTYPLTFVLFSMIAGSVLFFFFKISGGEGKFDPTVKMVGYTQAVSAVSFAIPTLGPMLGLYQLLLLTIVGKIAHKLDTKRSFIAVILPVILFVFLMIIITTILGVRFWGGVLSHENQAF